ncbi:Mu-like prophage protein gp37 [Achromobacter sp. 2789STDY5608621]|nr:Mu-like prophage protein gp37 [Achromobacter sp. 2789STDY5608621]
MARESVIDRIQAAMVERLKAGLGKMVKEVSPYSGEFDEDLATVVRQFPAAWVSFLGVQDTKRMNTSRNKNLARGRFTVMVGQRSVRSESAARSGARGEVGTNQLVYAIRRLLAGQDFGLEDVGELEPGAVRPMFNGRTKGDASSVYAIEFDVKWVEHVLTNGRWPSPDPSQVGDPEATDPDLIFPEVGGKVDAPYPWLTAIQLDYRLAGRSNTDSPDATDVVAFKED